MIYVPSSHLSLCVIAIRPVGLCACLCDGLWVVIETADCRTAYWRTQTIFRGNAKFHEFPIPLLISSVPTWVMHVVLCTIWPPHCWWPFANCMRLVACCNVLIMNLGKTSDCQKRQKYINKSFYLCVNQEWQTQVCETNWKVEEEVMVLGGVCLCVCEREREINLRFCILSSVSHTQLVCQHRGVHLPAHLPDCSLESPGYTRALPVGVNMRQNLKTNCCSLTTNDTHHYCVDI